MLGATNTPGQRRQVTGGNMRLICPKCGAQYEVPDEVIPEAGRDVQCSNCNVTWFQHHPDHSAQQPDTKPAEAQEVTPPQDQTPENDTDTDSDQGQTTTPDDDAPAPPRRELDPTVADILREEADYEREARAAESRAPLKAQPDLSPAQNSAEEINRREDRTKLAHLQDQETAPETPEPTVDEKDIAPSSGRDLLPDIDKINSSLDIDGPANEPTPSEQDDNAGDADLQTKRGGFKRGFTWAVLLALLLLGLYRLAPELSEMVPTLAAPLESYVEQVNTLRIMLDAQFGWVRDWIDQAFNPPA